MGRKKSSFKTFAIFLIVIAILGMSYIFIFNNDTRRYFSQSDYPMDVMWLRYSSQNTCGAKILNNLKESVGNMRIRFEMYTPSGENFWKTWGEVSSHPEGFYGANYQIIAPFSTGQSQLDCSFFSSGWFKDDPEKVASTFAVAVQNTTCRNEQPDLDQFHNKQIDRDLLKDIGNHTCIISKIIMNKTSSIPIYPSFGEMWIE